jgi:uncharacterized membrane protein YeiH
MPHSTVLQAFNPTMLLALNLAGTFVFGLSGGLAAVRARLDAFGVLVLTGVVGLSGGVIRDVLIGRPPATFRDPRYLAVLGAAAVVTLIAFPLLDRRRPMIEILDAAGLALVCVTGSSIALEYHVAAPEAVILGAISAIGGGMVRDVILREVPHVLRSGLYAIPALVGSAIAVAAAGGHHVVLFALLGALACFLIRLAGLRWDLSLPTLPYQTRLPS